MLEMESEERVRILVLGRPPVNALTLESIVALRRQTLRVLDRG